MQIDRHARDPISGVSPPLPVARPHQPERSPPAWGRRDTGVMPPEPKTCRSCGRRIEWRKKWERDWGQVQYCSTACRRRGVAEVDVRLEAVLLERISRGRTAADPADVALAVADGDAAAAGKLAEPARRAARRLVARGEAEIVQRGKVVDPSMVKGAFEVRRRR